MGPAYIKRRIFLIDGAHYLNRSTGNQLLKLLEEAPDQTMFILVSERPQLMLPTILSRARRFDLVPIPEEELAQYVASDCSNTSADIAAESAYMAAGRYVDAMALAQSGDWRAAVRSLAGEFVSGGRIDESLHQLAGFEIRLLVSAGAVGGEQVEENLAGLSATRRNELKRQSMICAIDRAAWWSLRDTQPADGFARRVTVLKARISQNVDPALATAAFSHSP